MNTKKNILDLMESGIAFHQAGKLTDAEAIYHKVLQLDPKQADALHFLGVMAIQIGQYDTAVELITFAINENPLNAFYFSNLGMALRGQGKDNDAEVYYRKAIALKPNYAEAYLNLGVALADQKKQSDAIECYRSAIAINPGYAEAYSNLGVALADQGELELAIINHQTAITLKPNYAQAHDNLGISLRGHGNHLEAIKSHQQCIFLEPNFLHAYTNLATTLLGIGKQDLAITYCLEALEIDPGFTKAYIYLSAALLEQGHQLESLNCCKQAFQYVRPAPESDYLLATTLLALGNLAQGWEIYEGRLSNKHVINHVPDLDQPMWHGQDLKDQTILVWGEQGIGDEIMFASMYADVTLTAKRTIFACSKKLIPLFARSFPNAEMISLENFEKPKALKTVDYHCAAGSLARYLRPTVNSFPRHERFLTPNPNRQNYWKCRLAELGPGPKIGICWRSGNLKGNRPIYCSEIEQWGPVFSVSNVHFINLQYGECKAELDAAMRKFGITIHNYSEVDLYDDLDESAALTAALDLVISAPTATGILAAALGVPTWQILLGSNWQSFGTEENLWYSCMHTIHKRWDQDWDEIFDSIAQKLRLETENSFSGTVKMKSIGLK